MSFKSFFSKKKEPQAKPAPASRSNIKAPSYDDDHDDYTDQVMHHLNSLHALTHPSSQWHAVIKKRGKSSKRVNDLHADVDQIVKRIGARKNSTF